MLRKTLIIAAATLPMLAFAASPKDMVGQWMNDTIPNFRVEVEPNGSNYIITSFKDNIPHKFVAVPKDGILAVSMGLMQLYADIEQKTGNLIFEGKSYRKLKPGEKFFSEETTYRSKKGIPSIK